MTIDSREGARLGGRTAPGSARLTMVMRHFPPREATTGEGRGERSPEPAREPASGAQSRAKLGQMAL